MLELHSPHDPSIARSTSHAACTCTIALCKNASRMQSQLTLRRSPPAVCSASATQKNTSTTLGASASYDGVSGGANTQFGSSMSQQTASSSAATMFQCNAAAFSYNLRSFANMDSSALDNAFYASTVALINVGAAVKLQWVLQCGTLPAALAPRATWPVMHAQPLNVCAGACFWGSASACPAVCRQESRPISRSPTPPWVPSWHPMWQRMEPTTVSQAARWSSA